MDRGAIVAPLVSWYNIDTSRGLIDNIKHMDLTTSISLSVVGTMEFIKRLFDKDFKTASIILGASVVGALVGHSLGSTWLVGALMGLGGSGIITTASYIGGK